ncbi:putative protein kinase RLK-Pelle-CR4L family [Helianthus anomalus]
MEIAIRRLNCEYETGDELENEISMLNRFKNKNIVSVLGHCDENNEKIIIYEQAVNGTLDYHLTKRTLTWSQRLQICLGVARALNHIHYDVIHCDINSSKIFLDQDWEPKIYGFEFSTEFPTSWRDRLLLSKNVTPKDDVYCFGVLLFEVLYERKPMITYDVVHEEPDKTIDPNLRKQIHTESLSLFKKIAYKCLNRQPVQRPTMDQIVKELDDMLELQRNANPNEYSIAADEGTSSNSSKMDFLSIPLSQIKDATDNFHVKCLIGSGGFGEVYRAELDLFSIQSLSSMKGKRKDEMPKVRKTVAIKRLKSRECEQAKQGFLTEIKLLTSCNHPNVVSLLGFCEENGEMIIVYEYVVEGSLSDYMERSGKTVTWAQRIQICLDVARGINYLHTVMEEKPMIMHRDIKSDNILLDKDLNAKVADFGLSKFHLMKEQTSANHTLNIVGTNYYLDPEVWETQNYKRASDIYSLGVVLFEVLSGRMAYDPNYIRENDNGLAPIARRRFIEKTIKELLDPMMLEDDEHIFTLNKGPNRESFDKFSKIAYDCLAETQAKRPTMEVIISELQNALHLQGKTIVLSRFQLSDINSATNNFDKTYCIGEYTNGTVYRAELDHFVNNNTKNNGEPFKKRITVAIKRFTGRNSRQVKKESFAELEMLTSYKHPEIASLLGLCDEGDEMILVYRDHAFNKSLDEYLKSVDSMKYLTWTHRLHICLETAHGLKYFHTNMAKHSGIKSANIVLDKNFHAEIASFGVSRLHGPNQEVVMKVYEGPEYETTGKLEIKSDIYSFGVVLFEIFCGRLAYDPVYVEVNGKGLAPIAQRCFKDGTIEGMIDPKLNEENEEDIFTLSRGPNQDSLVAFLKIAYQCLGAADERPTVEIVIKELERAINFQRKTLLPRFRLSNITSATKDFDETYCIGLYTNGTVYRAEIYHSGNINGKNNHEASKKRVTVAIKRFSGRDSRQVKQECFAEFKMLTSYKHPNIVSLLGLCDEGDEMILVYRDHASNKSLDEYLKSVDSMKYLTWTHRLHMCLEIAHGLKYFHTNMAKHSDIKSAHILIDKNCHAKIAYFGISKLHGLDQEVIMKVYEGLEYETTGKMEIKSDIYSFGVVLFEILCGKLAYDPVYIEANGKGLAPIAQRRFKDGTIERMIDPKLKEENDEDIFTSTRRPNHDSLDAFLRIAYQCLGVADERPTMNIVIKELERAISFQAGVDGGQSVGYCAIAGSQLN